jgi:hypothetical protein
MRISSSIADADGSHHATGTTKFVSVDGEGITRQVDNIVPELVSAIDDIAFCLTCDKDISGKTKYRSSGIGPYCGECYYSGKIR